MPTRPALTACLSLSLVLGPAPASFAQEAAPSPSALSPAEEFAAVCEELRHSDMPWYGDALYRRLAAQLEGFVGSPQDEARIRAPLGVELLKLGRPGEAIEVLEEAIAGVDAVNPDDPGRWGMVFFLGLAYLQYAEDQNCVERHNEASCILPLRPEGVHSKPESARKAADAFFQVVSNQPSNIQAAWLYNVARMLSGDYPEGVPAGLRLPVDAFVSEGAAERWIDRAPELGVNVFDLAGGAVMEDLDGDGFLDLASTTWDPCGPMRIFRSDGQGGFEDVTEAWGVADQLGGLNLVQADYDNDGDADLLVLRGGWMFEQGRIRPSLLRNDLSGPAKRFTDVTREAGLAAPAYPNQAGVWADYDGDGDLDLYLANEATAAGEAYPSQLYRNDGDGTFTDVAAAAGVLNRRYAKAAAWGDYDDDGDPDLYVSNLGPNRLYRNDGDGTFTDVAPELGVTAPENRSFGTWFFDAEGDGDLDLLVGDYSAEMTWVTASFYGLDTPGGHPRLYRNEGKREDGSVRFEEVSKQVGLDRPSLPMGLNYADFDNDGYLDFYFGTGDPRYEAVMPNMAYRNLGGRFEEVTFAAGLGHLQKGHGVAFGDLDNDGDQDLFHQLGGFYPGDGFSNALFENPLVKAGEEAGPEARWITLRLVGKKANRSGTGARIEVKVRRGEERRSIHLTAGTGASFGGSSLQQEIGLGNAEAIEEIVVRWPGSGRVDRFPGVPPNAFYRAEEGTEVLLPLEVPRITLGAGDAGKEAPMDHSHHGHEMRGQEMGRDDMDGGDGEGQGGGDRENAGGGEGR